MSNIAQNLTYLMWAHHITPTQLAAKTGVPQPTIFRIMKGESEDPRTSTVKPLADYFNMTVETLRFGTYTIDDNDNITFEPPAQKATVVRSVKPSLPKGRLSKEIEQAEDEIENEAREVVAAQKAERPYKEYQREAPTFIKTSAPTEPRVFISSSAPPNRIPIRCTVGDEDVVNPYEASRYFEMLDFPPINSEVYAIAVHGNALRPRARPGEFLIVDPVRPTRPGDDVIVHLNGGKQVVRTLLYLRNSQLTVEKVAGTEIAESISMAEVVKTECVIAIVNL